jgi:sensor histidine kinase YesM
MNFLKNYINPEFFINLSAEFMLELNEKSFGHLYQRYRVLVHILFWLGYLALYTITWADSWDWIDIKKSLIFELYILPSRIWIVYVTIYFLLPKYLLLKKYFYFIFLLIFCMIFSSIIEYLVVQLYHYYFSNTPINLYDNFNFRKLFKIIVIVNSTAVFVVTIKMIQLWYAHQKRIQLIEKEKIHAELQSLKQQLNPHFLFNTLNNLYGMSLKAHPKTSESILRLSQMMRYFLEKEKESLIPLNEEIQLLHDYLELEKLRYEKDSINVNFYVEGNPNLFNIPPLLLLPLVENAFKYGIIGDTKNGFINIIIQININKLIFKIENSVPESKDNKEIISFGIGVSNVKKRLELIYSNNFNMEIINENNFYLVILSINKL